MSEPDDDRWRRATVDAKGDAKGDAATVAGPTVNARPVEGVVATAGPFDPPRRDRFVERAELGRGGMGRVFEAHDAALDRPVAIKQSLTEDDRDLARFEREVRITAQLQHPGIVPVLDAGRDDTGRPYYIMRKIEGRRLADLIGEATTTAQRIALVPRILGAVDAIAYAHSRGVIHRDLKSWNVLLGPFGETLVIDWGLAREVSDPTPEAALTDEPADAPSSLTRAGEAYGTPGFMPPEQARGEPLGRPADVYALGAMLLHALQGEFPYAGMSAKAAIAKVAADTRTDLSKLPDEVPRELVAIVAKAMEPRAADRYADAATLAEDLRRFTTGQLVAAHEYSLRELIGRWLRRHRVAVTIGVLATVALAVIGVLAVGRVIAARDRADEAAAAEALRADELLIERADAVIDNDPTRAIALLKQLPAASQAWERAGATYDSAILRGVARGRVAHRDVRSTSIVASPEGDVVASIGDEGNVILHDPMLAKPPIPLAKLDEPIAVVWSGRSLLVATVAGSLIRIDRDTHTQHTLDPGGKVSTLLATSHQVFVIAVDNVLREIDLGGGPPLSTIGRARGAFTVGDDLVYESAGQLMFLPRGGTASSIAAIPAGDTVWAVAAPGGKRFAAAFLFSDFVIEYDVTGGVHERNRWTTKVRTIAYVDSENLVVEYLRRFTTLGSNGETAPRLRPTGMMWARIHDGQCGYLSTDEGLFAVCPGFTTRIGGKTDLLGTLALASDHLLGITKHGLMLSYDLAAVRPRVIRIPRMVTPSLFAGGRLWTDHDLRAIDPVTGAETPFPRLAVRCVTTHHAVLISEIPTPLRKVEVVALDTLARTPLATVPGVQCSATDDQIVLIEQQKLTLRDLTTGATRELAFDHQPDRVAFGGRWLAVGTASTGVLERVDLETGERLRTQIDDLRDLAVDSFGRIAIARKNDAALWDGSQPPTSFAKDIVTVLHNPVGIVAVTKDQTVIVIDEHGERRAYHQGTDFAPSISTRRPFAALPATDGTVVVVDLRDGSLRQYPVPAIQVLLDVDGTGVFSTSGPFGYSWSIDPLPPRAIQTALDRASNARVAPGSTRVDFAEP